MTEPLDLPSIEELEHLYSSLSADDRDQLLEELLVAGARGGEAMMRVLEVWLVDVAGQELLASLDGPE
jgi:hypothetical protein